MRKFLAGLFWLTTLFLFGASPADQPDEAVRLLDRNDSREAWDLIRKRMETLPPDSPAAAENYKLAMRALSGLNLPEEYETLLSLVETRFSGNLPLLAEVRADSFPSHGYFLDGIFHRGWPRGAANRTVSCGERDRVRVLKLLLAAASAADRTENGVRRRFYSNLAANLLLSGRMESWRLQELTDVSRLPDYGENRSTGGSYAPVNPDGSPVFYSVPRTLEEAGNDGERWRFALARAENPVAYASFLRDQFDFSSVDGFRARPYYETAKGREFLRTLPDCETVAALADGLRRLRMPLEHDYIAIFKANGCHSDLARIYLARMRFDEAAEELDAMLKSSPDDSWAKETLLQIRKNLGMLSPVSVLPAGTEPKVEFTFRNADCAELSVRRVDAEKLVGLWLDFLKNPNPSKSFPGQPYGFLSVLEKSPWKDCEGELVRAWKIGLEPEKYHFEKTIPISIPVTEPGAYVVTCRLPDGNVSESALWLTEETLTLRRNSGREATLFLNGAVTGKPVPGREVTQYLFREKYARNPAKIIAFGGRKVRVETEKKVLTTAADGSLRMDLPEDGRRCVFVSKSDSGYVLYSDRSFYQYWGQNDPAVRERAFLITDRPVYRPGDTVNFTGYLRTPSYSSRKQPDGNNPVQELKRKVSVAISDPRSGEIDQTTLPVNAETDSFSGSFVLPSGCSLGAFRIQVKEGSWDSVGFRVEEYKKPEYEVSVTPPAAPVELGKAFEMTVTGRYYFGSPMADSSVRYKITRREADPVWPFAGAFDWLYGRGYAICSSVVYQHWLRPVDFSTELVAQGTGKTDSEGGLRIRIDTAGLAEELGEKNYVYTLTAEMSDSTNRVVRGSGTVTVAAKPFRIYLTLSRGFYRTGDPVRVEAGALTPDNRPVSGFATLRLFRKTLDENGLPARGEAIPGSFRWRLGGEPPEFRPAQPGVYEAYVEVTDDSGHVESASANLYLRGENDSGNLFSESPLEIASDRGEYRPGDTARFLLSTNRPGGELYVFKRAERSGEFEYIPLGKSCSTVVTVPIEKGDMPNTFVEAFLIRDGKFHSVRKQVIVPPEEKVLELSLKLPEGPVKPRTRVPVELTVRTPDGKPAAGVFTMAVYDKALEAVAGGSGVPGILPFFWNWKRVLNSAFSGDSGAMCEAGQKGILFSSLIPYGFHPGFYPLRSRMSVFSSSVRGDCDMVLSECKADSAGMPACADAPGNGMAGESSAEMEFIRTDFLDTALWIGGKTLDSSGKTVIEIPVPDNLTTWKVRVWGLTPETRVGAAESEIIVAKDVIARLELPRFLMDGDAAEAVANFHNNTQLPLSASVVLAVSGSAVVPEGAVETRIVIPANGHASVPFRLKAARPGDSSLTLTVRTKTDSDALTLPLRVFESRTEKQVTHVGRLASGSETVSIPLDLPAAHRPGTVQYLLDFAPGAAYAMTELLPYLAADRSDNVYSLVNRFLPAAVAKNALAKAGINFADLHLKPGPYAKLYAEYLGYLETPSFDPAVFEKVSRDSLAMLEKTVNSDGGWGWFGGYSEQSWPETTAYVVEALLENGRKNAVVRNGLDWLRNYASERETSLREGHSNADSTDALLLRVLAMGGTRHSGLEEQVLKRKNTLSPYGLGKLALSLKPGDARDGVVRNLRQFLTVDDENGTAWLNIPPSFSWFWYGDENETNAAFLELLLEDSPSDPAVPKLANYLTANVRNSPWRNSTRSLGAVVRVLAKYMEKTDAANPDLTVSVKLDGSPVKTLRLTGANLWTEPLRFETDSLSPGKHLLSIERTGRNGEVYYTSMLRYVSTEKRVEPAGLELKLRRNFFRLIPDPKKKTMAGAGGRLHTGREEWYLREPIMDGAEVSPGDLVEVELAAVSKNDYDYVEFSSPLPAGFEYADPRSGWVWPYYAEYRERGAKFYLRNLARGDNGIRFVIRAGMKGVFLAPPATGKGVYAPVLRANTDSFRMEVSGKKP